VYTKAYKMMLEFLIALYMHVPFPKRQNRQPHFACPRTLWQENLGARKEPNSATDVVVLFEKGGLEVGQRGLQNEPVQH